MRWQWSPAAPVAAGIARSLLSEPGAGAAPPRTFPLADFQEDAVRRARTVMARRGGVIVADEVGLGKTYVALALIEEALREGEAVALLVPAAVRPAWTPLVRRIAGRGGGAALHVATHTRLSRGTHDARRLYDAGLVVVDEAHAFRNPATRRYRALAERRSGSRLLLLTATPVNNSVGDLYHLIRQFAPDDAFRDIGVASLRAAFLEPDRYGGAVEEAARIAPQVVVRRTRAEVGQPVGAGARDGLRLDGGAVPALRFPRRAATTVVRYDDPRVPALVDGIATLELAPYTLDTAGPARPGASVTTSGTEALLRLGLLKRLESGGAALAASLRRLRGLVLLFADAAERGLLLRPGDRPAGGAGSDDDCVQLLLDEVALAAASPGLDLGRLAASARRDADRLAGMLRPIRGPDAKLESLFAWAAARPQGEKAVIFTEFRDTAAALWRALLPLGGVGRVDGGGAWLGTRRSGRRAVIERFAPASSGRPAPPERERVDLLVATDVLSEGLNLQDAAVVVSYDLPWNPVRLLQRIGRVDRLGSLHDVIRPVVFVPDTGLDRVLRLTRTLRAKLGGIAATVGAGDAGELLARLGGQPAGDPMDAITAGSEASPRERLRAALRETDAAGARPRAGAPDAGAPLLAAAAGAQDPLAPAVWLVLARVADHPPALLAIPTRGRVRQDEEEAAGALRPLLADGSDAPTPQRPALEREATAAARRAIRHLRSLRGSMGPPRVDGGEPPARLARELRRALAALGPEPDPVLVRRVDEILGRLARPLDLAGRARMARVALEPAAAGIRGTPGGSALESLLDAIEAALSGQPGHDPPCVADIPGSPGAPAILAALRIPAPEPARTLRSGG
ncbi:MAG TPA: DEAD/DEAH box helicase [Longimicrobiales bacterium]|nr:DEAD/DEAH box helicase [Longimicrobiales bacterium]